MRYTALAHVLTAAAVTFAVSLYYEERMAEHHAAYTTEVNRLHDQIVHCRILRQ